MVHAHDTAAGSNPPHAVLLRLSQLDGAAAATIGRASCECHPAGGISPGYRQSVREERRRHDALQQRMRTGKAATRRRGRHHAAPARPHGRPSTSFTAWWAPARVHPRPDKVVVQLYMFRVSNFDFVSLWT